MVNMLPFFDLHLLPDGDGENLWSGEKKKKNFSFGQIAPSAFHYLCATKYTIRVQSKECLDEKF